MHFSFSFRYPVTVTSGPAASTVTAVATGPLRAEEDDYDTAEAPNSNVVVAQEPNAGAEYVSDPNIQSTPDAEEVATTAERVALPSFNRILFTHQDQEQEREEAASGEASSGIPKEGAGEDIKESILLHPGEENDHSLNATAPPGTQTLHHTHGMW